jgi:hypothetical protein
MPSPPLSIVQSISPRIAVLTSDDVVTACEANGCRGLEELLRPWEGATDRGKRAPRIPEQRLNSSVDTLEHAHSDYPSDIFVTVREL